MSFVSQLSFLLFSMTIWLGELISWHISLFYFCEKHTYNKPSKALVSSIVYYVQSYLWVWHAKILFYRKKQYPPFSKLILQNFSRESSSFLKWPFSCQILEIWINEDWAIQLLILVRYEIIKSIRISGFYCYMISKSRKPRISRLFVSIKCVRDNRHCIRLFSWQSTYI